MPSNRHIYTLYCFVINFRLKNIELEVMYDYLYSSKLCSYSTVYSLLFFMLQQSTRHPNKAVVTRVNTFLSRLVYQVCDLIHCCISLAICAVHCNRRILLLQSTLLIRDLLPLTLLSGQLLYVYFFFFFFF